LDKLKFLVFRHENALGNTCEQIINLATELKSLMSAKNSITVFVEHAWQKELVSLIKNSDSFEIKILGEKLFDCYSNRWTTLQYFGKDIYLPSYYAPPKFNSYNSGWEYLSSTNLPILEKIRGEEFDVIIQFREKNRWVWRGEKKHPDISRYVKKRNIVRLISKLCNNGITVARIGSKNERPIFNHPNFTDTTLGTSLSLTSQVGLISNAKLFISSDSSIWPLGPALGTKTLVMNVTSVFDFLRPLPFIHFNSIFMPHGRFKANTDDLKISKPYIFDWIGSENRYICKNLSLKFGLIIVRDNSPNQIIEEAKKLGLVIN
jgi:hypothetical protein